MSAIHAKLTDIRDGVCHFDDGTSLALPPSISTTPFEEVPLFANHPDRGWRAVTEGRQRGLKFWLGTTRGNVEAGVEYLTRVRARP